MCEQRSVGICCHESPHDEAIDPPLRPFHTVSEGKFSEVATHSCIQRFAGNARATAKIGPPGIWTYCTRASIYLGCYSTQGRLTPFSLRPAIYKGGWG